MTRAALPLSYLFTLAGAGCAWLWFNPLMLAWSEPCAAAIAHKPLAFLWLAFALAFAAPVVALRALQRNGAQRPALWLSALTTVLATVVLLVACLRWSVGGLTYVSNDDIRLGQLTVHGAPAWRQRLVMRRQYVDGAPSLPVVRDAHELEHTLDTLRVLIEEREVALRFLDDRLVARPFRPESCAGCLLLDTDDERRRKLVRFSAWPSYSLGRDGSALVYEGPVLAPRMAIRLCVAGSDGSVWLAGKLQEIGLIVAPPVPGTDAQLQAALFVLIVGLVMQLALRWKRNGSAMGSISGDFLLIHAAAFVTGLLLPVL